MSFLPTSQSQPIGLMPSDVVRVADLTPAIAGLREAFKRGLIDSNDVANVLQNGQKQRDALSSQFDLQTAQNQSDLGIVGDVTKAKQTAAQAESAKNLSQMDVMPLQTEATKAAAKLSVDSSGLGAAQNQVQRSLTRVAEHNAKAREKIALSDQFGLGLGAFDDYQKTFGSGYPVPVKEDGSFDAERAADYTRRAALASQALQILQAQKDYYAKRGAEGMKSYIEAQSELLRALRPNVQAPAASEGAQAGGQKDSFDDALSSAMGSQLEAAAMPEKLSPADQKEAEANLIGLETAAKNLSDAKQLVNDPKLHPVGPGMTEGMPFIGPALAYGKALRGDNSQRDAQRKLQQDKIKLVMDTARTFGGRLFQAELMKLEQSMPDLSDSPDRWNQWIDETAGVIQKEYDRLSGRVSPKPGEDASSLSFWVQNAQGAKPSPSTGAPRKLSAEERQSATKVNSEEERAKLPDGTLFLWPDGKYYRKGIGPAE